MTQVPLSALTCECGHHAYDHVIGLSDLDMSASTFRPCFRCECMSLSPTAREAQTVQALINREE